MQEWMRGPCAGFVVALEVLLSSRFEVKLMYLFKYGRRKVDTVVKRDTKSGCERIRSRRHFIYFCLPSSKAKNGSETRHASAVFLASVKLGMIAFPTSRKDRVNEFGKHTCRRIF